MIEFEVMSIELLEEILQSRGLVALGDGEGAQEGQREKTAMRE